MSQGLLPFIVLTPLASATCPAAFTDVRMWFTAVPNLLLVERGNGRLDVLR